MTGNIKRILIVLLALTTFTFSGCVSDAPPKEKPKVAQPAHPYSGFNVSVVFEGTVEDVQPSPGALSGLFTFFQGVHYRVDKVITGQLSRGTVLVYHILSNSPLVEKDSPELSKTLFKPGNKLLIHCERTRDGDYVDVYGVNTVEVIK